MKMDAGILADALAQQGIPVRSVSMGSPEDKASWRVSYSEAVTPEQRAAADAYIASVDTEGDFVLWATRYQVKAALLAAGRLDEVEAAIAGPGIPRLAAIGWENASHFPRYGPLVQAIQQVTQATDAEMDQLFRDARAVHG